MPTRPPRYKPLRTVPRVDNRDPAYKRGYDMRWRKLRRLKLARDPLCEWCLEQGITTPATEVHHNVPIRSGGRVLVALDALTSCCHPCHMQHEPK